MCVTDSVSYTGLSQASLTTLPGPPDPNIIFAVHKLARFASHPHEDHAVAIMYLGMYLNHTRDIGARVIGIRL